MTAELVGMSFSLQENEAYYIPVPAQKEKADSIVKIFKQALENPSSLKIGQNIKYDYIMMRRYGLQPAGRFFDTMVAHYLLQPEQRHNMDYLAEIYLGYKPFISKSSSGRKEKDSVPCATYLPKAYALTPPKMPILLCN